MRVFYLRGLLESSFEFIEKLATVMESLNFPINKNSLKNKPFCIFAEIDR